MTFIDTHCHLTHNRFKDDLDAVVDRHDTVHDLQVRVLQRFRSQLVRDLVGDDESLTIRTNFSKHVGEEFNRFTGRVGRFAGLRGGHVFQQTVSLFNEHDVLQIVVRSQRFTVFVEENHDHAHQE